MFSSPFLLNNLAVLIIVTVNFALCILCVYYLHFRRNDFATHTQILPRILIIVYGTASLIILIAAFDLFYSLEVSDSAGKCWETRAKWTEIKVGMTKPETVKILGEPILITAAPSEEIVNPNKPEFYYYCLDPIVNVSDEAVRFDFDPDLPTKTVAAKFPADEILKEDRGWIPDKNSLRYVKYAGFVSYRVVEISLPGIVLCALFSLLPFGFRGKWNSWMLTIPFAALVFGIFYEKALVPGPRFDVVALIPSYALILLGWLIRLIVAATVSVRKYEKQFDEKS